jgi:hypothetical protein
MSEVQDKKLYTTSAKQQEVLGLPPNPTEYHPREFARLMGRALLVKQFYTEKAIQEKGIRQLNDRWQAGYAGSVVAGLLHKVDELGDEYDQAVLAAPEIVSPVAERSDEPQVMPESEVPFPPNLMTEYHKAAGRYITDFRANQERLRREDEMMRRSS